MSTVFERPSYAPARSGRNSPNPPSAQDEHRKRDRLPRPNASLSFVEGRSESPRLRSQASGEQQPPAPAPAQRDWGAYVRPLWPAIAAALVAALALSTFALLARRPASESLRAFDETLLAPPQAPAKKLQEAQLRAPAAPKLIVEPPSEQPAGANARLGVAIPDSRDGGLIVVSGLAAGATLSAGNQVDDKSWWLSFADLDNLEIRPPPKFLGAMDITVELRLADTSLSDRQTRHIEWLDAASETKAADAPARADDQEGLLGALKRGGQEPISQGDVEATRQLARRAVDGAGPGAQQAPGDAAALQPSETEAVAKAQNRSAAKADSRGAEEYRAGCFVKIDGRVQFAGRCQIRWTKEASVNFALDHDPVTLTRDHGRTWGMTWGKRELGKVFKRGSCWGSRRVYICEQKK